MAVTGWYECRSRWARPGRPRAAPSPSNQVRGHESHVAHPAAQVQHPHASADASGREDHPGRRAERPALHLVALQLVDAGELIAGIVITDRCTASARAVPGLTAPVMVALRCTLRNVKASQVKARAPAVRTRRR